MSTIARPLSDVKGIGEKTAADLAAVGIDSVEALARASIEEIASVPGFGPARATAVRAAAAGLPEQADALEPKVAKKDKGKGGKKAKGKDEKKAKGKDKKKAKRKDKKKAKRKDKKKASGKGKKKS